MADWGGRFKGKRRALKGCMAKLEQNTGLASNPQLT